MNLNRITRISLFASLFLSLAACNQMPPIPASQAPAEANPQIAPQQVMNLTAPTYQIRNFNDLYNPYSGTDIGKYSSVALNSAGNPVIAIYDGTRNDPRLSTTPAGNGDLKLVVCNDPTCSSTTITTVDRGTTHYTDDVGRYNSMVLDSRGFPVIAYYDQGNGLMLAHCANATCTSKSIKKLTGALRIADIRWRSIMAVNRSSPTSQSIPTTLACSH